MIPIVIVSPHLSLRLTAARCSILSRYVTRRASACSIRHP